MLLLVLRQEEGDDALVLDRKVVDLRKVVGNVKDLVVAAHDEVAGLHTALQLTRGQVLGHTAPAPFAAAVGIEVAPLPQERIQAKEAHSL